MKNDFIVSKFVVFALFPLRFYMYLKVIFPVFRFLYKSFQHSTAFLHSLDLLPLISHLF